MLCLGVGRGAELTGPGGQFSSEKVGQEVLRVLVHGLVGVWFTSVSLTGIGGDVGRIGRQCGRVGPRGLWSSLTMPLLAVGPQDHSLTFLSLTKTYQLFPLTLRW